jgi:hypothetical protein
MISPMTRTIYHEDDSVILLLSDEMVAFFAKDILDSDGNVKIKGEERYAITMTAEEYENLERHASEYEPPAPLLQHELAEIFGDDPELPKYLDTKKKELYQQQQATFTDNAELLLKYPKSKDKETVEYYQEKNAELRQKLQSNRDEIDRMLAFMGRGGKRKIKNFQLELARAKAFPIDKLLDFSNNRLKTQCVWHEDSNPSLYYYRKNNTVWCFACGNGGDSIDVVRQMKKCSLPEAIKFINQGRV